ncbi:MAG: YidC/Oxa1 family insertase periplasmic-domain containing protein [Alistipes putredinis]|nr:MAG: YidC/Oxa1 family insertase periplasmic-domain containing protein [Alistipes putredinis]
MTRRLNTGSYNFVCDAPSGEWSEGEQSKNVSMRLYVDSTAYVEYLYTVYRDSYMMDFDIRFVGMASMLSNQSDFEIAWSSIGQQNEKGFDNENNYSTISYKFPDTKSIENLGMSKAGQSKSEDVEAKVQWVAFKQQYFSSVMIADGNFQKCRNEVRYLQTRRRQKSRNIRQGSPCRSRQGETSYKFKFYYGPNKYSILKKIRPQSRTPYSSGRKPRRLGEQMVRDSDVRFSEQIHRLLRLDNIDYDRRNKGHHLAAHLQVLSFVGQDARHKARNG